MLHLIYNWYIIETTPGFFKILRILLQYFYCWTNFAYLIISLRTNCAYWFFNYVFYPSKMGLRKAFFSCEATSKDYFVRKIAWHLFKKIFSCKATSKDYFVRKNSLASRLWGEHWFQNLKSQKTQIIHFKILKTSFWLGCFLFRANSSA